MRLLVLTAAVVLMTGGTAFAQAITPPPERECDPPKRPKEPTPEEKAKQEAKAHKAWEKYLEKYPTEVPDIVSKPVKEVEEAIAARRKKLPPPSDADTPDGRALRATRAAQLHSADLISQRIASGQFIGGESFTALFDTHAELYSTTKQLTSDPVELLPWAECYLLEVRRAEEFIHPRVEQGVDSPVLLPLVRATRCRAEVEVLMLRERTKKK